MIFDEFDGIHASDEIKQKTLHNVMKQRSRKKRTGMTAALTLCVTCLLVVLFQPWRLMEASPAPAPAPTLAVYSYVTLDINPSMEWKRDEQQRVVRVTAYNKDADNILTELQLEGVQLDTALRMLLDNEQFSAYMKTGFLEVSVYSENSSVSLDLEQQINQQLNAKIYSDKQGDLCQRYLITRLERQKQKRGKVVDDCLDNIADKAGGHCGLIVPVHGIY